MTADPVDVGAEAGPGTEVLAAVTERALGVVDLTVPFEGEKLSEEMARKLTEDIRGAVVRLSEAGVELAEKVVEAYSRRVWVTLGYSSWEDYCAVEFSGARIWQTAARRKRLAATLHAGGLSRRAVAAVLGVSRGTAAGDISTVQSWTVDSQGSVIEQPCTTRGQDGKDRPAHTADAPERLRSKVQAWQLCDTSGMAQTMAAQQLGASQASVSGWVADVRRLVGDAELEGGASITRQLATVDPSSDAGLAEAARILGVELVEPAPPGWGFERSATACVRDVRASSGALASLAEEPGWSQSPQVALQKVADGLAGPLADLLWVASTLPAPQSVADASRLQACARELAAQIGRRAPT
ncbi:MAG: hypothetical protein FWD59_01285 [Micrococcales bacterium]|nr:hypothetical protein [Micrococcales bacterium]